MNTTSSISFPNREGQVHIFCYYTISSSRYIWCFVNLINNGAADVRYVASNPKTWQGHKNWKNINLCMRCGLHEINQSIFESLFFPEKLVPNTFFQILDRAVSTRISSIRVVEKSYFRVSIYAKRKSHRITFCSCSLFCFSTLIWIIKS